LSAVQGDTSAGRCKAFASWRLNWQPGTRFEYHPTSAHWVLAEIIERVTGSDYRDVVQQRVTDPAGLDHRVLGDVEFPAAELIVVGEQASPDELEAALGIRELPVTEVTTEALMGFNDPASQRVGVPGGGGVMRAADLALYYQAVLHNPGDMWNASVLNDAKTNVRNHFPDLLTGAPANRTLGLIQAGGDDKSNYRGMGRTVSEFAVGHNGAKGQIAWGDPVSGLSLGFCTNGLDENILRESRRTTAIASLAGLCNTD
jgi:CubicO group peptidase (beta-lactamase class C family)